MVDCETHARMNTGKRKILAENLNKVVVNVRELNGSSTSRTHLFYREESRISVVCSYKYGG